MFNTPNDRDDLIIQIDSLKSSMEIRDLTIGSLRKQLQEIEQRVESVKDYIKSMMELGEFVSEDMNNVADLLDIILTKKYDVDINVIYRGTVEIPLDQDIDKLSDHIEFEFSDKGEDDWDVDIFQYDVNVNWDEVS
jgi:hypothetical protein